MSKRHPTKMHGRPPCNCNSCATNIRPPTRQERRSEYDFAAANAARRLAEDVAGMMRGEEPALLRNLREVFGSGHEGARHE